MLKVNPIEKPIHMLELEARWRMPFERKLVELRAKHGNMEAIAEEIGISRNTLYQWTRMLGISIRALKVAAVEYRLEQGV